jgi:hypothetical protein
MAMKRPRSTQDSPNSGRLPGDPPGNLPNPPLGPRTGHEQMQLSRITTERRRTNASPLAARNTKFRQNMTGQVRVPGNLISANRGSSADQTNGARMLDVGQVPED